MRHLVYLAGIALLALALYLLYRGATLIDANLATGSFSLRVWQATFWLKRPPVLEHGIGQNALALLEVLGGAMLAVVGCKVARFAATL